MLMFCGHHVCMMIDCSIVTLQLHPLTYTQIKQFSKTALGVRSVCQTSPKCREARQKIAKMRRSTVRVDEQAHLWLAVKVTFHAAKSIFSISYLENFARLCSPRRDSTDAFCQRRQLLVWTSISKLLQASTIKKTKAGSLMKPHQDATFQSLENFSFWGSNNRGIRISETMTAARCMSSRQETEEGVTED